MSSTSTTWGIDSNTDASSTLAPTWATASDITTTWATASDITTTWAIDYNTSSQLHSLTLSSDISGNTGHDYYDSPIGYIYGTELIHGMSIVDLGIAIPELKFLISPASGGVSAVRFTPTGLWVGSLTEINIYNNNWNEHMLELYGTVVPPPTPGLEMFSMHVFSDVELDGTYFVTAQHPMKNRSTWVESSDITTTWA